MRIYLLALTCLFISTGWANPPQPTPLQCSNERPRQVCCYATINSPKPVGCLKQSVDSNEQLIVHFCQRGRQSEPSKGEKSKAELKRECARQYEKACFGNRCYVYPQSLETTPLLQMRTP